MKEQSGLLYLVQELITIINTSSGKERTDEQKFLYSRLPGLVTKILPAVPQLKKEFTRLGDAKKNRLLSLAGSLDISKENTEKAVMYALLILEIVVDIVDNNINTLYTLEKADINITNPPREYWFQRTDAEGEHQFFKDNNYLCLKIPEAHISTYFNAEIYNSPYTAILPKNVIINPYPVDDPQKDIKKFIYDLFLNLPYAALNKLILQCRAKAEHLKGGSRGWGFWNTSVFPLNMQIAWFVQYDGIQTGQVKPAIKNGFYAQTQNGVAVDTCRLASLDEKWHDYRIELGKDSAEYFIDGKPVHKVTNQTCIPQSPMAFHCWVDNAVFGIDKKLNLVHILQDTDARRTNVIQSMSITSIPHLSYSAGAFYSKQTLLPHTQTPDQLSAWLSANHPDYDLASWCIFGNLINEDGSRIDTVSSLFQFQKTLTDGICLSLFEAGFTFNSNNTDGYLLAGTGGLSTSPSISITPHPWSVVVNYDDETQHSVICFSLINGQMGRKDAMYMLTADVNCLNQGNGHLTAEIRCKDRLGVVNEGYGPASFLPQWINNRQQAAIKNAFAGSMDNYLAKTEDPMRYQGAYYYSAPILDVEYFKITKDTELLSEGIRGTLWLDYVVQSFDRAAWTTISMAEWKFFAVQIPDSGEALMVSEVITEDPESRLYTAKYFSAVSTKAPNGALLPDHEWPTGSVSILPDKNSKWTSGTGAVYYLKYVLTLDSPDFPVSLSISAVRDDQEVVVSHVSKYEGVFTVSGTINHNPCKGYAWGELVKS